MRQAFIKIFVLSAAVFLVAGNTAHAAEPELIEEFGGWSAYVYMEENNKICYMVSKPQKEEGDYAKRGNVYTLITHRPAEKSKNVFSFVAGYPLKVDSEVIVSIGSLDFKLFTQNETAWAPDPTTDNRLTAAVRGGTQMIVKGKSAQGTETTDTFSLKGSTAAYTAISKECGIR